MKNICFVVTDAVSFNVLYRGQLEYLSAQGHRLTLICGGAPCEIGRLRERCVGEVIPIDMVRAPCLASDFKALIALFRHFLKVRYNVVVVTTPKAVLLGSLAARLARQPRRIVFFRGRVYENFSGIFRYLYLNFDRLAAWCAHEVLFVSRSLMDEYCRDWNGFSRKGRVLGFGSGNGVDTCRFLLNRQTAEAAHQIRNDLNIGQDDFVVLSVGRICIDKGLAEFEAVARLAAEAKTTIKFVTLGAVEDGCEEILNRLSRSGNVKHVGFTEDVSPYFAMANVHLFLTHREGFGNVAVEAAAMGVPTIAFDVVGVRDSVADGVSGVRIPFGDVEEVWREIERMYLDPEGASREYSGSRQWVLDNFRQDRVWDVYAEYYAR